LTDTAMSHTVSCHCGYVRFEVDAVLTEVVECNCSVCVRSAFLHWYVEPGQVRLLTLRRRLSTYVWRSVTGGQQFCPNCGIAVIRTSTQFPPPISVNVRCVENIDLRTLTVRKFDGRHLIP
jgi:hypothetical protein